MESPRPELFFGLVAPVGSDLSKLTEHLEYALSNVGYKAQTIHIIEQIHELEQWKDVPEAPLDDRINKHMDAGNELRRITERGDAVVMLGIGAIRKLREVISGNEKNPARNTAFIIRSLKHPSEVETLRTIYGDGFFLIAAYSPRNRRIEHLSARVAESHHRFQASDYRATAETLNERDESETGDEFGQNVRNTFPLADLFVDTSDATGAKLSIENFVELLFAHPFHTPNKHEYAMFHAQAAALRSSALGRQVGAVVATSGGDIIAVGTNEVPKSGGGLYWSDDQRDGRDFKLGYDTNDKIKYNIITEILQHLKEANWLSPDKKNAEISDLVKLAVTGRKRILPKTSQVMNVTEFGRAVHAEMAALMDAARRGAAVAGATLYTTTFPCHNCAKHIVAAGIKTVIYIEPYPKSLALDLHLDAITIEGQGCGSEVSFRPFVGIAPRRYMDLFTAGERKGDGGKVAAWSASTCEPRFPPLHPMYALIETKHLHEFSQTMMAKNLKTVSKMKGGSEQ